MGFNDNKERLVKSYEDSPKSYGHLENIPEEFRNSEQEHFEHLSDNKLISEEFNERIPEWDRKHSEISPSEEDEVSDENTLALQRDFIEELHNQILAELENVVPQLEHLGSSVENGFTIQKIEANERQASMRLMLEKFVDHAVSETVKEQMDAKEAEVQRLTVLLEKRDSQMSELQELFRTQADSLKKLQEDVSFTYIKDFLADILLLLDNLDEQIANVEKDSEVYNLATNMRIELIGCLDYKGLEEINVQVGDLYDANVSRIMQTDNSFLEDGEVRVGRVIRKGYKFQGKLLRRVEVIVTKSEGKYGKIY